MTNPKTVSEFTKLQKLEELWRRGVLAPWLLHDVQKRMHAAITGSPTKKYVVNSSRRLGKSFMLCVIAQEYARQHDNAQIKYAADTQRSVKKIILPLMKQIMETCPKHLRPKFKSHDGVYEFPNGSEIHIAGSSMDQADSLRGTSMDLGLVDEAGFIDDLEYLIDSILLPQTLTRPHARIILASTPSKTPDHPFVAKYMAQAMAQNAYSKFTIYDNPLLSKETIEEFKAEAGGERSTTWLREYMAEVVTETANAIFPEVASGGLLDEMVYEVKRPPFFIPIVVVDLGYTDFTGVLLGYYHFPLGKIVIEDGILVNRTNSAEIVRLVTEKERELWGPLVPRSRIVDGPPLAIADMNETHRFSCRTPDKSDLQANVNRVRVDLANKAMIIHPRCTHLISQVRFATWDGTRTKFSRNSSGGHWDLVAALVYLNKHIDRNSNPFPAGYGWDPYNDFGFNKSTVKPTHRTLLSMFPLITRR